MKLAGDRLRTLNAQFEQTNHDYIMDEDETSSGNLYLNVPGRIRWEYGPPRRTVLLVKGDKIQLYNPAANQVQEFERGQMRGVGVDLLIGFGSSNAEISKNYDVRLVEETASTVVLELIPKPDSSASIFRAIELTMDKKRWIPVISVFHEPNRDTTEIRFLEVQVNSKLPPRIFELKLPPGVEIIRGP